MKFTYNPRIIQQLGTELITSDEVAISELIKNSYDARASKVNILFVDTLSKLDAKFLDAPIPEAVINIISQIDDAKNIMVLEDNGKGMDKNTLEEGFFKVGTTIKKEEKEALNELKDEDILLGDKGIGRLSAQRLSPIIIIETSSEKENESPIFIVKVEWERFINDENAESEDFEILKLRKKSYTRLWFIGTNEFPINFTNFFNTRELNQYDIFGKPSGNSKKELCVNDELQSILSFLYSPFEEKKTVLNINLRYNSNPIKINFHADTLKIAESVHEFKVKKDEFGIHQLEIKMVIQPWFIERIHRRQLGKALYQDWKKEHSFYNKLFSKYKNRYQHSLKVNLPVKELINRLKVNDSEFANRIADLSPIEGKVYSFKRNNELLRMAIDSALKNNYILKESTINEIKPFLDIHNGIKLYRNKFRIATLGDKDSDWLKLQQKRTKGQQFYRFELGNVTGFVKINDLKQKFIYETSSREAVKDTKHSKDLLFLLDYVFDAFTLFNKSASEISKDILDEENLIPKNTTKDIKEQIDSSSDLIKKAKQNLSAFNKTFLILSQNKELDTQDKIDSVKRILGQVEKYSKDFGSNLTQSLLAVETVSKIVNVAEQEKKRIEVEAYNNYKLMANGLITEVITHELHSLLTGKINQEEFASHFKILKSYLLETKKYSLEKKHLTPIRKRFEHLHLKMSDLNRFYQFLEKTFIYKGTSEDFENAVFSAFLNDLTERFDFRFSKYNIHFDHSTINMNWHVPRGSLLHVFYNLIDNSIYWIRQRQLRALYDNSFATSEQDKISIKRIDDNTVHYYDSGIGVLEKYQFTLFHPLVSGKENGRGMGLYIVRKFLESFDAKIELLPNLNEFGNRYIFEISIIPQSNT